MSPRFNWNAAARHVTAQDIADIRASAVTAGNDPLVRLCDEATAGDELARHVMVHELLKTHDTERSNHPVVKTARETRKPVRPREESTPTDPRRRP